VSQIKIYIDEDAMDSDLVGALRSRGVTVITAWDAGLAEKPDEEQLAFATARECVLYTFNVSDFYRLHTQWIGAGREHAGMILAQQQRFSVGEQMRRILRLRDRDAGRYAEPGRVPRQLGLMTRRIIAKSPQINHRYLGPQQAATIPEGSYMPQPENTQLLDFINAGKTKGASDEFLAALLLRRGWPADDVYAALGQYWENATGLVIPERSAAGESAKDAFLYLLSFSTLAAWTGAFGSMLFQFIDYSVPDAVSPHTVYSLRSTVTWQMASIAVAFPIYLLVMKLIFGEAANHPERLQSGVRKWLTYIALLGTAGAVICDLIWFLDYFLTGELTLRFVLKAATVMLICGSIFAYYLGSLRWNRSTDVSREKRRNLAFGAAATAVVIVAFCVGLGVAGTPSVQRRIEGDRKREQDLRNIAIAVNLWRDQPSHDQPSHDQGQRTNSDAGIPATLAEIYAAARPAHGRPGNQCRVRIPSEIGHGLRTLRQLRCGGNRRPLRQPQPQLLEPRQRQNLFRA
jgi:uncharacterized membrane protein YidH (DUF202 family)